MRSVKAMDSAPGSGSALTETANVTSPVGTCINLDDVSKRYHVGDTRTLWKRGRPSRQAARPFEAFAYPTSETRAWHGRSQRPSQRRVVCLASRRGNRPRKAPFHVVSGTRCRGVPAGSAGSSPSESFSSAVPAPSRTETAMTTPNFNPPNPTQGVFALLSRCRRHAECGHTSTWTPGSTPLFSE
jgi:hypothetical protein